MSFKNIDDVKKYVCEFTDRNTGNNVNEPQGIDELIIEFVNVRAIIYSFQNTVTDINLFKEKAFFSQWLVGSVYTILSTLGKLVSKDHRDHSLRKLWENVSKHLLDQNYFTQNEFDFINQQLDKTNGKFTNNNSKAILFRNKLIAHNETYPRTEWSDIDSDFRVLIRIWSLLISSCSFGFGISPFRSFEQAFDGLESFFNQTELTSLKIKHSEFLQNVELWCKEYAYDLSIDTGKHALKTPTTTIGLTTD